MNTVRPEHPDDRASVREVNERAFGRASEADLLEVLRRSADPYVSLVAEEDDRVVGHIFFSPVDIESDRLGLVMGLAPMAVIPERQREGIGSSLVRAGLTAVGRLGAEAVVVLGHPEYYPRFGFTPAATFGLRSEYNVPDEVFMALEIRPGALEDVSGIVKYDPAFSQVD